MNQSSSTIDENTVEYWKRKYKTLENEFNEFCQSSGDLEHELNLEIDQLTKSKNDFQIDNERLRIELESLRLQIKEITNSHNKQFTELTDELTRLKNEKGTLQRYVRELEQNNDDLERAYRVSCGSLADFEDRLNKAIEKNAILENELEEKESMIVTVQRLKEEARDLRQDLEVKEVTIQQSRKSQVDEALVTSMIEEQSSIPPVSYSIQSTQTDISTTLSNQNSDVVDMIGQQNGPIRTSSPAHLNHNSLSPSSKVTALHLVSEMLKKVGQIENKLIITPNIQPSDPSAHKSSGGDSSNHNDTVGGATNAHKDPKSSSTNQSANQSSTTNSTNKNNTTTTTRSSRNSANQSQTTSSTNTPSRNNTQKMNGYHANNKTNHFVSSSKSIPPPPSTLHCTPSPSSSFKQLNGYERSPKQATRASIQ